MAAVRLTQLNVNTFNCKGKQINDIYEVITDQTPDILFLCETFHLDLRPILPPGWSTNQFTAGKAGRQESAVCWKTAMFNEKDRGLTYGTNIGNGKRYFSRVDLAYDGSTVRFASCHVPRYRSGNAQAEHKKMMGNLVTFIKNSKYDKVCVGGDFNINFDGKEDPWKVKAKTNTVDRTFSGDGFILKPSLSPSAIRTSNDLYTDHRAISTTIDM